MNERSIMHSPQGGGGGMWVDRFLPNELDVHNRTGPRLIDADALRGAMFRQRWLIAIVMAVAVVLGVVATMLATPVYQAESTVLVNPDGRTIVDGQEIDPRMLSTEVDNFMQTQGSVIESRNMAYEVVDILDLVDAPPAVIGNLDEDRPEGVSDEDWLVEKRDILASIMQGSVEAEVPFDTRMVTIKFESEDAAFAARAASAYSDAYVRSEAKRSLESNSYAQEYLQEQIAKTRTRLQDAELAANAYAKETGIVTQEFGGTEDGVPAQTITGANLANINQTVTTVRAERIAAEQRWRAVANVPASQLPEVQGNSTVQGLLSEKAKLQGELSDLKLRYSDDYPPVLQLQAQIDTLERQIQTTSANIKASIRNAYLIAQRQEQGLSGELQNVSQQTLDEQDRRVRYTVLEREAQAIRDQLQSLLTRYNSVSTAANVQSGMITKLDDALIPLSPVSPSLFKNLLIALVGGVAVAGGLALLREAVDDKLRSIDEVEEKLGVPLLGHTPFVDEDEIEDHEANQFSALMEAYASIRSTIDYALPHHGNVIQLTSSQGSEGKSTTALILAELFARAGRKTLLIDADLRKPSLARFLKIARPTAGLVEVLTDRAEFESALVEGTRENLDILPLGQIPSNPIEILSSPRLHEFIERHRQDYSLIILDSSPVLGLADAPLVARCVDTTVFIVEANGVQFGQARNAMRRLRGVGGQVLGVILTKFQALQAGQSYDYQYRYYQYSALEE